MSAVAVHGDLEQRLWRLLEEVPDPEIPVLSIVDLGVVRYVHAGVSGSVRIGITPTYSGCPATDAIRWAIRERLDDSGFTHAVLEEALSPAWSSDWLTESGRRKLAAFGIAPPLTRGALEHGRSARMPRCPRCQSEATERLSEFGSTPCKAHYRCLTCREPFDYFKCI